MTIKVKVLGTGCPKCNALEDKVRSIAQANSIPIQLEKVKDLHRIMEYAVMMMTPALVVNEEVKSTGRIPGDDDILKWLKGK